MKIKIQITINDDLIMGIGTLEKNIIKLDLEKDYYEYDIEKSVLTKKNKELELVLDFVKEEIEYNVLELNKKFHNKFNTLSLTNLDKEFIINYQIEETSFLLQIKYETIN